MIWNTIKRINSIIWNEFKNNKILFILPMILSVTSYLFDVYNRYVCESMIEGLIIKGEKNAETLSQFIKVIAEREFLKSANLLTSGFCDWYYSAPFTFICGLSILCMPFILFRTKFKIAGIRFFKIYSWIVWIPVGIGSVLIFVNGFLHNSPDDIMSFRFVYALSQSMLLICTLGLLSVIFLISLLQIYYYSKFFQSFNQRVKVNDMFRDLLSKNIFKLFIWNVLFAFLMLMLSLINLTEQIQIMFYKSIISKDMINKLYPYQTFLRLLIVPWLILIPFQIIKSSTSLKNAIIDGINIVRNDRRQYFGIFIIIFSAVFLMGFIVDLIVSGFSLDYSSSVFYILKTMFSMYCLIGLFVVYFRKYICNEEMIVSQ